MAPRQRKKVLLRFADLIEKNTEELAVMESVDSGKTIADAVGFDVPETVETLRWHAEALDKLYDQVAPTADNIVAMVVREPIGVVGLVLPWNFPLYVTMWKLAPALAGGNSVIIKPSELTSLTTLRLAKLAAEAGLPEGVLSVVPGFGETAGQALGRHADVDCLSFTGSGEVGRYFLQYSAETNLKRVVLELGGKSPAVVLDDVRDLKAVAEQVAIGCLFHQGQNCSAGSRLIVQQGVKNALLDELVSVFKSWTVGDPLDPASRLGALVEEKHMNRILSYIDTGKKEGARLILGGGQVLQSSGGFFLEPTIFDEVTNSMTIAREEIFGPVLSIIACTDTQDAIRKANETNYGLAASLYTDSVDNAHQVAKSLRAGQVSVNCFSEGDQTVPFGGYKQSGFGGRDKGLQAHEQYLETKAIWMQLAPRD